MAKKTTPARKADGGKKKAFQVGALPFARTPHGLKVLLVTSRDTGKWIIPKGWAEKKRKPWQVAASEAFEEAGVVGEIDTAAAASFTYRKGTGGGGILDCEMKVYLLEVREELADWPEKGQRERRWVSPSEAAMLVSDAGMVDLLLRMAAPV